MIILFTVTEKAITTHGFSKRGRWKLRHTSWKKSLESLNQWGIKDTDVIKVRLSTYKPHGGRWPERLGFVSAYFHDDMVSR